MEGPLDLEYNIKFTYLDNWTFFFSRLQSRFDYGERERQ